MALEEKNVAVSTVSMKEVSGWYTKNEEYGTEYT